VSADWFYDTVEAIDDVGIAVSGVIVDGVNDIPTAIVDFLEVVSNVLVKTRSVPKHPRHILYITNIPTSNVFVKVFVMIKQIRHISYAIVDFLEVSVKMVLENP
jgi:hypothetical protein